MRYARAQDILPAELLAQLQAFIDGAYLYIPRKKENRLAWGERTHSKRETEARNREIFLRIQAGETVRQLAEAYYLSEKTVRRIVAAQRKARESDRDESGGGAPKPLC